MTLGFFIKVAAFIVLAYIIMLTYLYTAQRAMTYHPDTQPLIASDGMDIIEVTTDDGLTLRGLYIKARDADKPTILYFHGNAGSPMMRIFKAKIYAAQGYGVLLAGYRGFNGNAGDPSEEGFYRDGRAYMNALAAQNVSADRVVLYGESIGSGTATQMATEHDVAGLILEAPFTSLPAVASRFYPYVPADLLMKDRFDNLSKIAAFKTPLLVMHGTEDSIVPHDMGETLFQTAQEPKTFVPFTGADHVNIYDFGASVYGLKFLDDLPR